MPANDGCLIWGEGPVGAACLGAATPRPPVPLLSNRAARRTATPRRALLVPLIAAAALGAGVTTAQHTAADDRTMTYDGTGRMARFESAGGRLVVTRDYDASGTLVREVVDRPGGRSVLLLVTGMLGPGAGAGLMALQASVPALYAAAATTVLLDSRLGEGIAGAYASLFQDLGLSPRSAGIAGRLSATWLLNSHFQRGAAGLMARSGPVRAGAPLGDRTALDGSLARHGIDAGSLSTESGDAYGTTVLDTAADDQGLELDRFNELTSESGEVVGVYGVRDIGAVFDHGAAGVITPDGAGAIAASGDRASGAGP